MIDYLHLYTVATSTSCRCSVVFPAFSPPLAAHSPYSHVTLDDHNRFVMAPGAANANGGVDPLDVKPVIGNQQQQAADYQRMMQQHAANMGRAHSLNCFTKTMDNRFQLFNSVNNMHGCVEFPLSPLPSKAKHSSSLQLIRTRVTLTARASRRSTQTRRTR